MQDKDFETAMIPFAVHEAQMARNAKQMKLMTIALCFMALMMFLMAITIVYGYEEEVTTTTTETTTETVEQDSGDGGSNTYAGGDVIGEANYNEGYDENDNDDQETDAEVVEQQ